MHGSYETYETYEAFHLLFHLLINAAPDILLREIISIHLARSPCLRPAPFHALAICSAAAHSLLFPTFYSSSACVFLFSSFSGSALFSSPLAASRRRCCLCCRSICCSDSFPRERVNEAKSTRAARAATQRRKENRAAAVAALATTEKLQFICRHTKVRPFFVLLQFSVRFDVSVCPSLLLLLLPPLFLVFLFI